MVGAFSIALLSCSGSEDQTTETTESEVVNQEEIIEVENATNEVSEGLETLEQEVEQLNNEIDSLLNDI